MSFPRQVCPSCAKKAVAFGVCCACKWVRDWTETPPTAEGTYWIRAPDLEAVMGDDAEPSPVMLCNSYDRGSGVSGRLEVHRPGYEEPLSLLCVARLGWLWWPEAIKAPPLKRCSAFAQGIRQAERSLPTVCANCGCSRYHHAGFAAPAACAAFEEP